MKYPILNELPTTREMISTFRGYNHNLRIADGEFYDMTNLSSNDYPVLSPRKKRGIYATPSKPQGLIAKDSLCYVDGSEFVINGYPVPMGLSTDPEMCPKTLVSMGAYVIIMPDKKYINTTANDGENAFEFGDIERTQAMQYANFSLCDVLGTPYNEVFNQKNQPESPQNGDCWLVFDSNNNPIEMRRYSPTSGWTSCGDTYVRISFYGHDVTAEGFSEFNAGDSIFLDGILLDEVKHLNNGPHIICGKGTDPMGFPEIWIKGICGIPKEPIVPDNGYAVPNTQLFKQYSESEDVSIKVQRKIPNMDFVIESQNRLWGCCYGVAINGEIVNEIYASKLGDFKNWQVFAGVSTDSWTVGVGTDGPFTGAVNYLGYPVFFKDNCMHKVYGNYPAQYQVQTTMCRGVQKGCEKSLAIVNEVLYYKSRHAICSYDGSLPQEISSMLGNVAYHDAVGGSLGNKYYVSMKDEYNATHLFVCDTARGLWHREDNTAVKEFCTCRGNLYFIDKDDGKIKSILEDKTPEDGTIKWMAETGILGTDYPDKKYISRIDIRLSLNLGTRVILSVEYDSSGRWEHLFTMMGTTLKTFSVPVKPKRCDHLRLRIEGEGEAKIYSICKTIEQGSDI